MTQVSRKAFTSRLDGARLSLLRASPQGAARGSVVVIQEIFGLSEHIAELCALFADAGYQAYAPGLFERIEPNFAAGHDAEGVAKGREAVAATPWPQAAADMQTVIDLATPPVFITGFCYGGSAAWLAAARCAGLAAASCFYGRLIRELIEEAPRVPVLLHYGARDASIPVADIEAIRLAHPNAEVHIYDAGHGFCRKASADYHEASAALALSRTLSFFEAARR